MPTAHRAVSCFRCTLPAVNSRRSFHLSPPLLRLLYCLYPVDAGTSSLPLVTSGKPRDRRSCRNVCCHPPDVPSDWKRPKARSSQLQLHRMATCNWGGFEATEYRPLVCMEESNQPGDLAISGGMHGHRTISVFVRWWYLLAAVVKSKSQRRSANITLDALLIRLE